MRKVNYGIYKEPLLRSTVLEHYKVQQPTAGTFAATYAGMNEIRQVKQSLAMSKAENLTEWQTAMEMHSWPSINFVYADYQGNIGYVYNGKIPQRNTGYNWKGLLPGDTSKILWKGVAPFSELPMLFNPASDYVFMPTIRRSLQALTKTILTHRIIPKIGELNQQ